MWIWLWLLFVFFVLVVPLAYGSGYRRWGAPYPYYSRRRRVASPDASTESEVAGWGWFADFLWLMAIVAVVWLVAGLFYDPR